MKESLPKKKTILAKPTSKVTHQGKWKVTDEIEIDCYVTDDKKRLLSLRGTARAMDIGGPGSRALLKKLKSKWIKAYLSNDLVEWIHSAECNQIDRVKAASGPAIIPFEATLFVDVCKAYIQAWNDGVLTKAQSVTAARLLKIMTAFAKIGIVSLVDEITGYQEERQKDALQDLLKEYISEEFLVWTKTFPDEFYLQIFRLRGWENFFLNGRKMPGVIGYYTNELVYKQLPEGVLDELKKRTPKSGAGNNLVRYHQSLSKETGVNHLNKHLIGIITLMKASDDWETFMQLFNNSFSKHNQLRFNFAA